MSVALQSVLRISVGALSFALVAACARSPPRAAPDQPGIAGNAATDGSSRSAMNPLAGSPTDVETALRKRGYKPESYRGERVYCRNETLTGSNLESKVCFTAEQIEDQERAGKNILNGNRPAGCLPKTGCN